MAKNAYLIASDLHLSYKNLRSRIDYRKETDVACNKLKEIAASYKEKGYNIILLLLGDVFHRSYNDVFNACNDNNFFYMWANTFGKIYSVIGNHELTYYSSNPFYTLISEIKSEKVHGIISRVWQPVGSAGVIDVIDRLDDGDTTFYFNHYGTQITVPSGSKHSIGLFHQDLVSQELLNLASKQLSTQVYGNTIDVEGSGIFDAYNYAFLGHMHTVYGTFRTDAGTILCYLASLGRTNITEVNDNFLERNIPVVCVEDGSLAGVFDNKFLLPAYKDCVKVSEVVKHQEEAALQKEKTAIKRAASFNDDPVQNVIANLSGNALASKLFKELLEQPESSYGKELHNKISEVLAKPL